MIAHFCDILQFCFFCLVCFFTSQLIIFQSCRDESFWVEQVLASCSRTQHSGSASGEARTSNPAIASVMLYQLSHCAPHSSISSKMISGALTHDFQQCGILTIVDSDEPVQPLFKVRHSKWGLVSSLTVIEYWSNQQRLWSVCAYAQAGLSLCWSHIPHCWKSHAMAQLLVRSIFIWSENWSLQLLFNIEF